MSRFAKIICFQDAPIIFLDSLKQFGTIKWINTGFQGSGNPEILKMSSSDLWDNEIVILFYQSEVEKTIKLLTHSEHNMIIYILPKKSQWLLWYFSYDFPMIFLCSLGTHPQYSEQVRIHSTPSKHTPAIRAHHAVQYCSVLQNGVYSLIRTMLYSAVQWCSIVFGRSVRYC